MDDWRKVLTRAAFAGAICWLALLAWLEAKGRTRGWRRRLLLAVPLLVLLTLIAALRYGVL